MYTGMEDMINFGYDTSLQAVYMTGTVLTNTFKKNANISISTNQVVSEQLSIFSKQTSNSKLQSIRDYNVWMPQSW